MKTVGFTLTERDIVNFKTIQDYYIEEKGFKPKNSQIVKEALAEKALAIRKQKGQYWFKIFIERKTIGIAYD